MGRSARIVSAWLAVAAPALAQQACPAGTTLAGTCAKASSVDDARMSAILLAQPKLSKTNPPVAPEFDRSEAAPIDLQENRLVDHMPGSRGGTAR